MGTLLFWQTGPASRERLEATSPRTATTRSREMSLVTTVEDSPSFDCVSSVRSRSFLPSTPPALFNSSMAISVPRCDDRPKAASFPVSEAYSPMGMVSPSAAAPSGFLHPVQPARAKIRLNNGSHFARVNLMRRIIATEHAVRQSESYGKGGCKSEARNPKLRMDW